MIGGARCTACDRCLRRGYLVGHLASHIAGLLDRPHGRVTGLLALPDEKLLEAAAGEHAEGARAFLEEFDADRARESVESSGIAAVCRHDPSYPTQLEDLADAPPVLFVKGRGDLACLTGTDPGVAVVGARRASTYGLEMARELGRGLGAAGVTVVSGLALGIDAQAHRGCLEADGAPVAVLACGPDISYPRTNRRLYERVCERGLVIAELPPGQRAFRWSFPARNRIMAGLARMTVVVEAAEPSGSLITSDFAIQVGRPVGAVPGQVTSSRAAGSNALLKDGATFVTSAEDVLEELFGSDRPRSRSGPDSRQTAFAPPPDPVQGLLLEAVEAGLGMDGACAHSGLPIHEVRAGLSRLEASGHVTRNPMGIYRRTAAL
ncbi:MAG: DNA-processing protein DprA [Actinomycetota bacterium]|nr:DNA-processing protein DprA [Actinomycetota bacterium]